MSGAETFPEGEFARIVAKARAEYWTEGGMTDEEFVAGALAVLDIEGRILPPGDSIAAAEQRGRQWAIDALLGAEALQTVTDAITDLTYAGRQVAPGHGHHLADYALKAAVTHLEALATQPTDTTEKP